VTPSGRPRSPVTLAEYRRGRAPANKGRRYPAEILTPSEVHALLDAFPRGPAGTRSRAAVVLLWRSGLRVAEALALRPQDVDLERGAITVLHGKGDERRVVGIDAQAVGYLREWLEVRERIGVPAGALLFCTVSDDRGGPGRPFRASALRNQLKRYARKAGIEKRCHPHGLRHTHAAELANESIPVHVIQAQLGHKHLGQTAHYIAHLAPRQVLDAIAERRWPGEVVPVAPSTRAAASQGKAVPLRETQAIPAYTPVPQEPSTSERDARAPSQGWPPGESKAKILKVLRQNGGRATQAQLARALRMKDASVRKHCEQLAAAGAIVRGGELARPRGGRPFVVWALPALKALYQLDGRASFAAHARRGQGAARVLHTIEQLGGRASQSQVAGELGISSETVGVHCRALEQRGELERGGLDKATSNRGSQVWRLPSRERFASHAGPRLRITPRSSVAGGRPHPQQGGPMCAS
jgi:predicted ArsR family transcriptional regulator